MNNSLATQQKSEVATRIFNIKDSIAIAFERTATVPYDISCMVNDIESEFPKIPIETIQAAIRKGSLGEFGYTYKLSTQVVCIWIREHIKRKNQRFNSPIL